MSSTLQLEENTTIAGTLRDTRRDIGMDTRGGGMMGRLVLLRWGRGRGDLGRICYGRGWERSRKGKRCGRTANRRQIQVYLTVRKFIFSTGSSVPISPAWRPDSNLLDLKKTCQQLRFSAYRSRIEI